MEREGRYTWRRKGRGRWRVRGEGEVGKIYMEKERERGVES